MSDRFNPSEPLAIGLEWPATRKRSQPVDFGAELASIIESDTALSMRYAGLHIPGPGVGGNAVNWWGLCSVYEEGDELLAGDVRSVSVPVVTGSSTTGTLNGGAANVADALAIAGDAKNVSLATTQLARLRFAVPTYLTLNPRILSVRFEVMMTPDTAANLYSLLDVGYRLNASGNVIPVGRFQLAQTSQTRLLRLETGEIYLGAYDYVATPTETKRAVWTKLDVGDFNTGTVELRIANNWFFTPKIEYARMVITYCDENRVAAGAVVFGSFVGGIDPTWWYYAELRNTQTRGTPVTLSANTRYLQTWTRAVDPYIDTYRSNILDLFAQYGAARNISVVAPEGPPECFALPRVADGRIVSDDRHPIDGGLAVIMFDTTVTAAQPVTQPYADVIRSQQTSVQQEVISTWGGVYTALSVTCRAVGDPGPFTVAIGTTGQTAAVTEALLTDPTYSAGVDDEGFATVTVPLSGPAPFVAGVEQTLSATSLIGSTGYWEIPQLNTLTGNADGVWTPMTYKGTAQRGGDSGVFNQATDYPMVLHTAVPAVTGLGVAHATQTLAPAVTGCPKPVSQFVGLDYAVVTWSDVPVVSGSPTITGAPLVTGFCAWEVQRSDTIDTTWRPVGRITTRSIRTFQDFEGRIGVATSYRVRLCRVDGVCGDWATATGFTRAAPTVQGGAAGCDGLVFASNENSLANVAYPLSFEGTPLESFTFVEAEQAVLQRLHMRDYQVAFKPLERGGVSFERTVLVNSISVPAERLDRGFLALRDLAWASLSYVAVLDTRGDRWLAAVRVPSGTVRSPNNVYLAQIVITEVTDRPSVVDMESV